MFIKTQTLSNFGYFRVTNLLESSRFSDLVEIANETLKSILSAIQIESGLSDSDIPISIELPARPENDVNFSDFNCSLAELAGISAALELLTSRECVFYGVTYLGKYSTRWFNILVSPNSLLFNPPEQISLDRASQWINKARGNKGKKRLELFPSLPYLSCTNLYDKFDVQVDQKNLSVKLANIEIDGSKILPISEPISRANFHLVRGFAQAMYLGMILSGYKEVTYLIVGNSLSPFIEKSGRIDAYTLINTNRIASYI